MRGQNIHFGKTVSQLGRLGRRETIAACEKHNRKWGNFDLELGWDKKSGNFACRVKDIMRDRRACKTRGSFANYY